MLEARLLFSQFGKRCFSYFRGGNLENVNQDIEKIAEGRIFVSFLIERENKLNV